MIQNSKNFPKEKYLILVYISIFPFFTENFGVSDSIGIGNILNINKYSIYI